MPPRSDDPTFWAAYAKAVPFERRGEGGSENRRPDAHVSDSGNRAPGARGPGPGAGRQALRIGNAARDRGPRRVSFATRRRCAALGFSRPRRLDCPRARRRSARDAPRDGGRPPPQGRIDPPGPGPGARPGIASPLRAREPHAGVRRERFSKGSDPSGGRVTVGRVALFRGRRVPYPPKKRASRPRIRMLFRQEAAPDFGKGVTGRMPAGFGARVSPPRGVYAPPGSAARCARQVWPGPPSLLPDPDPLRRPPGAAPRPRLRDSKHAFLKGPLFFGVRGYTADRGSRPPPVASCCRGDRQARPRRHYQDRPDRRGRSGAVPALSRRRRR